jgi:hypothetical protein
MLLEKLIHVGTAHALFLTKARLLLLTDYSTGQQMTDEGILKLIK